MPIAADDIEYDDDCSPIESGFYGEPVHRFNGRVIPPRKSPLDPVDPEVLAFMKSLTPLVEMAPHILSGMPVFKDTLVPIKRMFDYLLAGRSIDDFLSDFPSVPSSAARNVLGTESTLFYEAISKAIEALRGEC